MVTNAMPICHHLSRENSKNRIESQLQYKRFGVINGYYYVTLPIYLHAKATVQLVITNLAVQIFAMLMLVRMKSDLGMDGLIELGLNLLHDLSKCNSTSNFSSVSGFRKSANFNSNLILKNSSCPSQQPR